MASPAVYRPGHRKKSPHLTRTPRPRYAPSSPEPAIRADAPESALTGDPDLLGGIQFTIPSPECWISNAELMHHFTLAAVQTLPCPPESHDNLRTLLPQLGFSSPFLLRQIMAFAGLHLAHLHAGKRSRYQMLASHHEHHAAMGLRQFIASSSHHDSHAAYVTSVLLCLGKFAAYPDCPHGHQDPSCCDPVQNLVGIFGMATGMQAISKASPHLPMGPISIFWADNPGRSHSADVLEELMRHCQSLLSSLSEQDLPAETLKTVATGVHSLISALAGACAAAHMMVAPEVRVIFHWPMLVSRELRGMVSDAQPAALALLAHYGVLLGWAESRYWYFEGWARPLFEAIVRGLEGTRELESVRWALATVGMGAEG